VYNKPFSFSYGEKVDLENMLLVVTCEECSLILYHVCMYDGSSLDS